MLRTVRPLLGVAFVGLSLAIPSPAAPPPYRSPELGAPGEVTFRLFAPEAKTVFVEGLRHRAPVAMTKAEDGLWSVTVRDLPADIYGYDFNVDGVATLDSHNRYFKRWNVSMSAVEVEGTEPTFYAAQPVPHGTLHRHLYSSAVGKRELAMQVYTPPGYDPRNRTRYPVIVLFHGTGDDETTWTETGRVNLIADNLISRGAMKKAIIVMPYGHPVPQQLVRPPTYPEINIAAMETCVINEVLPFVEANYHVSRLPEERAIVGLSMGGGQALAIGLSHPELFRWVGAFSAAPPASEFGPRFTPWLKALQDRRHAPRLLWLAIGREDDLLPRNEALTGWLGEHHVPFSWKLTDGGHEWSLWREYFFEFAQAIFR